MKKLLIGIFSFSFISISLSLEASTGYDIKIDNTGYDLKIELNFSDYQTLSQIRNALVQSKIISGLSPNVKSVTYSGTKDVYQALMVVKSFGIKSELLSKCQESQTALEWKRDCVLQTELLDGGKYMVSKSDSVVCRKNKTSEQNTTCQFRILGKTKNLSLLGIQILNERSFAVKAKVQALNNFFKIYYFIQDNNISLDRALMKFDQSNVMADIAAFDSIATKELKTKESYVRSFKMEKQ